MNKLKTYEKRFQELEDLVKELDQEELPMATMLDKYKRGLALVTECTDMLRHTEEEMKRLIEEVPLEEDGE